MHDCAAGRACRDPVIDTETGRREPALIEVEYGLCTSCQRAVRQAIRELPDDYAALGAARRTAQGQLVAVSSTPDPVVPIHVTAQALTYELGEWAEAAMILVCNRLNVKVALRQKMRGYPVDNLPVIQQASRVLVANLDLLLDAPARPVRVFRSEGKAGESCWDMVELDGIEVALKLQRAHAKVRGVLGESNPRRRLTMPCPVDDCGMPTLGVNNGETDVTCTSCGGRWSEAEIDWLMGMIIGSTSEKEIKMLQWLLAEARWLLEESIAREVKLSEKLSRIRKLTDLGDELKGYDATALAQVVGEVLDER